jgi:hypothetical protein
MASKTDSCMQSKVQYDGSLPKYFDPKITGFVSFKRRMELSIEDPEQFLPRDLGGGRSALSSYR